MPVCTTTEARFEVTCDVNGCIITPVAPRARSSPAPAASIASTAASMDGMDVEIHEGDGWKLVGSRPAPVPNPPSPAVSHCEMRVAVNVCNLVGHRTFGLSTVPPTLLFTTQHRWLRSQPCFPMAIGSGSKQTGSSCAARWVVLLL